MGGRKRKSFDEEFLEAVGDAPGVQVDMPEGADAPGSNHGVELMDADDDIPSLGDTGQRRRDVPAFPSEAPKDGPSFDDELAAALAEPAGEPEPAQEPAPSPHAWTLDTQTAREMPDAKDVPYLRYLLSGGKDTGALGQMAVQTAGNYAGGILGASGGGGVVSNAARQGAAAGLQGAGQSYADDGDVLRALLNGGKSAAVGAGASLGLGAIGAAASKVGEFAGDWGRKMGNKALGATTSAIGKLRERGIDVPDGDLAAMAERAGLNDSVMPVGVGEKLKRAQAYGQSGGQMQGDAIRRADALREPTAVDPDAPYFYHTAPAERSESIARDGIMPGRLNPESLEQASQYTEDGIPRSFWADETSAPKWDTVIQDEMSGGEPLSRVTYRTRVPPTEGPFTSNRPGANEYLQSGVVRPQDLEIGPIRNNNRGSTTSAELYEGDGSDPTKWVPGEVSADLSADTYAPISSRNYARDIARDLDYQADDIMSGGSGQRDAMAGAWRKQANASADQDLQTLQQLREFKTARDAEAYTNALGPASDKFASQAAGSAANSARGMLDQGMQSAGPDLYGQFKQGSQQYGDAQVLQELLSGRQANLEANPSSWVAPDLMKEYGPDMLANAGRGVSSAMGNVGSAATAAAGAPSSLGGAMAGGSMRGNEQRDRAARDGVGSAMGDAVTQALEQDPSSLGRYAGPLAEAKKRGTLPGYLLRLSQTEDGREWREMYEPRIKGLTARQQR